MTLVMRQFPKTNIQQYLKHLFGKALTLGTAGRGMSIRHYRPPRPSDNWERRLTSQTTIFMGTRLARLPLQSQVCANKRWSFGQIRKT